MADQVDRVAIRLVWDAGVRARQEEGKAHLDNPHPVGSEQHEAWFRGWAGLKHPAVES